MFTKSLLLLPLLLIGATTSPAPTIDPTFHLPPGSYVLITQTVTTQDPPKPTLLREGPPTESVYYELLVDPPTESSQLIHATFRRFIHSQVLGPENTPPTILDTDTTDPQTHPYNTKEIFLNSTFTVELSPEGDFVALHDLDQFQQSILDSHPQWNDYRKQLLPGLLKGVCDEHTIELAFLPIKGMLPPTPITLGNTWTYTKTGLPFFPHEPIEALNKFTAVKTSPDGAPLSVTDYAFELHKHLTKGQPEIRPFDPNNVSMDFTLAGTGAVERNLASSFVTSDIHTMSVTVASVTNTGVKNSITISNKQSFFLLPGPYKK